jgi:hypothetical protein
MVEHVEMLRRQKAEGLISNEDFTKKIEEHKKKLDDLIAKSPVTVETRKIIRARAQRCTLLYLNGEIKIKRKLRRKLRDIKKGI